MRNNNCYTDILKSLFSQIEKGRVGVCGELKMSLTVKGNEHEYNRCIRNLDRTFKNSHENYKVYSCENLTGKILTTFTSSRFALEVVNV